MHLDKKEHHQIWRHGRTSFSLFGLSLITLACLTFLSNLNWSQRSYDWTVYPNLYLDGTVWWNDRFCLKTYIIHTLIIAIESYTGLSLNFVKDKDI